MNSKCTDNTKAHDDKSGTMTWVGWLKGTFKQKSKQNFKTYFLTAKDQSTFLKVKTGHTYVVVGKKEMTACATKF